MVLNNYSYCIFLTKRLLIRIFNRNCNNWERISISKKDYKRCRSNGTIIIDGPKERINLNANGLSTQKRMIEIRGRMRSCVCLSTIQLQFLFFFEMVDERVFRKAQKSVVVKLAWSNIIDGICSINVDTLFGSWFTDLTPFRLVRSHLVTRFESRYRSIVTRAAQGLVILRRRAIRNVKCITESTLAIVTNVLPVQSIS